MNSLEGIIAATEYTFLKFGSSIKFVDENLAAHLSGKSLNPAMLTLFNNRLISLGQDLCLLTVSNDVKIQHAGTVVHEVAQINKIIRSLPVIDISRAGSSTLSLLLYDK